MKYTVAALYQFTAIADPVAMRLDLKREFERLNLCGTLLVAPEGINGTLAGMTGDIDAMLTLLNARTGLALDEVKFSHAPEKPFNRLKIRLKREIITFNQPDADPVGMKGTYVEPQDWNKLTSDPDVIVLDTRNKYETSIGVFEAALDPQIERFTDFATFVEQNLDPARHKKIAMYCTGGIRCEKASAYMRAKGFDEVYHLKGGILKYLETVPAEESKWRGDCYVFDKRMAVGQGLATGHYSMCFCCGAPLSKQDKEHPHFEDGVSCECCFDLRNNDDKNRFRQRHQKIMENL